jgi:hypothetical protein
MRKEYQVPPLLTRVLRSMLMVSLAIGALSTLVMHLFVQRGLLSGFLVSVAGVFLLTHYLCWAWRAVLQPVRDEPASSGAPADDQAN